MLWKNETILQSNRIDSISKIFGVASSTRLDVYFRLIRI